MMGPSHYYDPYDRLAPFYDWTARALLVPFGGEHAFRSRALGALDLAPGTTVLELGCGTGSMTRHLSHAGAEVTAVDLSEPMLRRARRKNPGVRFVQADILDFDAGRSFDRVLFSFVLHEMDEPTRERALASAKRHLLPDGLLGLLDFWGGAPAWVDRVFRAYLRVAEPEPALELLRQGFEPVLRRAGFQPVHERELALGTAKVVVSRHGNDEQ